jgi:hypothetical protein
VSGSASGSGSECGSPLQVLPERLPGLQSRVVTGLQVEPGVLVVRWQSQWPAPTLWSGVRDMHQAYHKLAVRI